MRAPSSYAEPFSWWGPVWTPPAPRGVVDLIRDGTLSPPTAGVLAALLARRASVVVVAEPSGAGKTTLLTALLELFPADSRRIYLRGCYEPFAFLDDPSLDPIETILLINEISGHLPAYLWGDGVRRALEAAHRGFALAATAHAQTAADLVRLLAGYPLRIPLAAVAAFNLVVVLDAWEEGGIVRRKVAAVTSLAPPVGAGGLGLIPLVDRPTRGAPANVDRDAASRLLAHLSDATDLPAARREIDTRTAKLAALAAIPWPPRETPPSKPAAAAGQADSG